MISMLTKRSIATLSIGVSMILTGCTTSSPTGTPWPTLDLRDVNSLCGDLSAAWGKDWPRTIADLEKLRGQSGQCDGADPTPKLYAAYYNYGAYLDAHGDSQNANKAYQNALAINPQGVEASQALRTRQQFTPAAPTLCPDEQVHMALNSIPAYKPQLNSDFVKTDGNHLQLSGKRYPILGVNYYPANAPWQRFLTESELGTVAKELDLIHGVGFNTLRIFLYYEALFDCPGNGAVPKAAVFARLDGIIQLAAARGLRLIVTLNDLPDLGAHPLYIAPQTSAARTQYIVSRYKNEPAILAWDLRNEGDIDYTRGGFSTSQVLGWLSTLSIQVRQTDPNHLITAGWSTNSQATEGVVDIVSFHAYSSAPDIQQRMDALKVYTRKPILLEETGFSTFGSDEVQQATVLREVLSAAAGKDAAGWLVWTAFDFPTNVACAESTCAGMDSGEYHFGLWHTDYTPKPAVQTLKALIASESTP